MATGPSKPATSPATLTMDLLKQQNDRTSEAVIAMFKGNDKFEQVSKTEFQMLRSRDDEDAEKLVKGITISVQKGVLPAKVDVEPVTKVVVDGKTAERVANEIYAKAQSGDAGGKLLVFQGLSGTGKGTTVATLKSKMPNAVTWSNGNVFRALTLLLVMQCEQDGVELTPAVITAERVEQLMKYLSFGKFGDQYDIQVDGLGVKALVCLAGSKGIGIG